MITSLSVFWYYKDKFYGKEATLNSKSVIAYGDYMQLKYDHFKIWSKYKNDMGIKASYIEYTDIPRGRILFHIPTHHYIVIGSSKIVKDTDVQSKLLQWYNLPNNTEFRSDEHYD